MEDSSKGDEKFSFNKFSSEEFKQESHPELLKAIDTRNKPEEPRKKINFQKLPDDTKEILDNKSPPIDASKYLSEDLIPMPYDNNSNNSSYLSLVLSPNLRELEMMIRGLEYVKRFNPILGREEIILRKIPNHPLNEFGINRIMAELKVYCSPEIKLGRKRTKDYYQSVQHVSHSIVRLIYKNLRNFGMDTQVKQRNAKAFCNAIIEFVDASYSRSVEGKENDLSRATELKIEGTVGDAFSPTTLLNKQQKEQLKKLMATFKEINKNNNIDKKIKKSGLSLAIIFSTEELKNFNLEYDDTIRLDDAEIIKSKKGKSI